MTEELDWKDVKRFVRKLQKEYEKRSVLSDLFNVQSFLPEDIRRDEYPLMVENIDEPEFIQIGKWMDLPTDVISPGPDEHLIGQFVHPITTGERNFVINRLDKSGEQDVIPHVALDDLEYSHFENISNQVMTPDYLLLPIEDEIQESISDWSETGKYYFTNEQFVIANNSSINIDWYSVDEGTELEGHGYLFDSSAIDITQKWHGDSPDPKGFDHNRDYDKFSLNRPFMVYLGEEIEDYEENEDFDKKVQCV
jgi:hypothetical protein